MNLVNLARVSYGGERYEVKRKRDYATREGGRGKNRNKDKEGERCMKKRREGESEQIYSIPGHVQ
jgi:hypothetical protein